MADAVVSPDRLIDPPETARRLGVSARTVIRLANRGFLQRVPVLGATRYRESDVEKIVADGTRARDAA